MAACCKIELFGGLRILQGERTITRFRTRKTAGLLAYLAYHPGRQHPRETLIEMLWPWADPQGGRQSLSMALSSLRRQVEPPRVPAGAVIITDRDSAGLNAETVTTDVAVFEAELREGERAIDVSLKVSRLEEAVNLYTGQLLSGLYEPWITAEQVRLSERFVKGVVMLAKLLAERGQRGAALSQLRRAIEAEPLREEPRRELMRIMAEDGEPGAAFDAYHELVRVLDDELGEEPSATTKELIRELERRTKTRPLIVGSSSPATSKRSRRQAKLPAGTVTLLGIHERGCDNSFKSGVVLREEISRHGGIAVESFGEEMIVAFSTAGDALSCAAASQSRILNTSQEVAKAPPGIAMALHTAELTLANGGCYPDGALGRARRLLNATHPAQILCSESTAGLLRYDLNGGLRLRDLGVYRLRGASGSERLFQLDYPGGPVTLPALDAEAGFASHIPLQLTRFFGRQHELRSLEEMLLDSTRLVTLIGPPGCGKSRLAIEMANRLVAPFHGRVWFVPLADHQGDRFVFDLALQPLGINRLPQATPLTQIAAAIADDRALIVLDNFEHLVERAGEINDLLAAVPRLHCLVTSRRRLNLVGEQEFPVDPLTIPDPAAPDLFRNECVELFVDRAQAVRPDFQLTEQNTTTVADICRKLEGIPLSIELAARRTGVLGLSQIRDRAGRAEDLMSPNRDVENRHRSLRAAIKWSYELLPAEIQRFFACLSTFRGGWTTEAAAVVCDEPLALDYLSELADCSLISVHHGSQDPRFHMLEMVRAYAAERLAESGLQAAARQLHAKYFEELAIRAYAGMEGPDLPAWLHRLDADIANITCALDWFESTRSFEKAIWLVTRLFRFWSERGHHVTALHLFDRILNLDTESRRTKAHASGLEIVGNLRDDMGDFVGAQEAFAESLSIFEELADRRSVAGVLSNMSCVERNRGDYALARTHLEQALGINRELGNRLWESFNLDNLSVLARTAGDYQTARLFTEEALALHRELGDRRSEGLALGNLGTTLWLLGDRAEGHRLAVQSRQVSRQVGEAYSSFFNNLIYMKTELGEFASARTLLEEESELIRQRLLPARAPSLLANVGCLILAWPSPGGEMWMPQLADE